MQTKIKLFIFALAVLAILSVFSFFDIFSGVKSALLSDSIKSLPPEQSDQDHDGLLDNEESYWGTDFLNPDSDGDGFLDGEEVASGHDPLTPGPEDKLAYKNVTNKLAELALGGLMDGTLKSSNPQFEPAMESLALSVVNDGVDSFAPPVKLSEITLIEPTKENQKKYFDQIRSPWEIFVKAFKNEVEEIGNKLELIDHGGMSNPDFIEYFSTRKNEFNLVAEKIYSTPVPKNWLPEHSSFLRLSLVMAEINSALAQGKDDPVRASIAFNLFLNQLDTYPEVLNSYLEKADKEKISN